MTKEEKVKAVFADYAAISEKSPQALALYDKSRFGELVEDKLQYSIYETLYLIEKGKLDLVTNSNRIMSKEAFVKKSKKNESAFLIKYITFKDMRDRGYIVKTALKFGADFRIYDRGVKPGEDHAKWILYPVSEAEKMTWYDFAAKNRVAHSTKKNLLIGIVDVENSVTYYEISWQRP